MPKKPLPPSFSNMEERVEEHDRFMNAALVAANLKYPDRNPPYALKDICPDCYGVVMDCLRSCPSRY